MGVLYTPASSVPSASQDMMVSMNDLASSSLVSSTVNLIVLSVEFMCCKNLSLGSVSCMTNILSLYNFQSLGGFSAVLKALVSKSSKYQFATVGLTGDLMAGHSLCSYNCPWKRKHVLLRQNSNSCVMWCTDMLVPCQNCVFCSNLFYMAGPTVLK